MSFYIQPYPFRRTARRVVEQPHQNSLRINIRDDEDAYTLYALVPGLKAEDLNIQVLENVVCIEGEYKADEDSNFVLNEIPQGGFRRALRMPAEIDAEKVEAKIVDGVLTLTLPKAESARPKKIKIAVN
jgi:HSP20 family protein